ncbi:MAG: cupin domain-containing protein [Bryobacterales bacterium]|nr:cupin domain-containing protein [Bryobacterales bacterium]
MRSDDYPYVIHKDVKYSGLTLIDVNALAGSVTDPWYHQTLLRVNDCVVRFAVVQGEFHWHHHEAEDEFFYVISGELHIDLDDRTVSLRPNHGYMVPHGVRHRTRAPERTAMLMIAGSGVEPTGDKANASDV